MIGKSVSHYKILEKIGGGGMGVVYKARDENLDRLVALKFLPPQFSADEEEKERFIQEAKAASSLDHPNICTVHEIGEAEDGQMFIAMAFYQGATLNQKLAQTGALPPEETIELALGVAEGLAKAHEAGITHRDIKPANLMITTDNLVKIVDFGLAKVKHVQLTKTGTTLGTAAYMSPEQALGKEIDQRTDIWSLGVVLYEMLTGQLPFSGDYDAAIHYAVLNEKPTPIADTNSKISADLQKVVSKALQKDRDHRYQRVEELASDLRREKETLVTKRTTASLMAPAKTGRSRVFVSGLVGVLFVAFAAIAFFLFSNKDNIVTPPSERKMLAVLPFENLGAPEDEYFADGLTEELTSRLAAVYGLGVISRTSAVRYKNTQKSIDQISQELGVDYVVAGTVRWERTPGKTGSSMIRVTPKLIRARDDSHIWSDRYDSKMEGVFDVQSDIAEKVVRQLDVSLVELERRTLRAKPTDNMTAYDYLLRANDLRRQAYASQNLETFEEAVAMYERAAHLDPSFLAPYIWLAFIHGCIFPMTDQMKDG
ncbi:serine/threonine-protein kinase [bacterium]|nr:serine/threonine-protein kinase [bacterium]